MIAINYDRFLLAKYKQKYIRKWSFASTFAGQQWISYLDFVFVYRYQHLLMDLNMMLFEPKTRTVNSPASLGCNVVTTNMYLALA